MKLSNYPKYHYGKQLYKRNTGWYDHYNNSDNSPSAPLGTFSGCMTAIVFVFLGLTALKYCSYTGSFLSWIGGILLLLGLWIGGANL